MNDKLFNKMLKKSIKQIYQTNKRIEQNNKNFELTYQKNKKLQKEISEKINHYSK